MRNHYANQQQANYGNQTSAGAYGNQQATGNPYANQQATGNPYAEPQIPTGGFDPNAGGTINISDEDLPF